MREQQDGGCQYSGLIVMQYIQHTLGLKHSWHSRRAVRICDMAWD